MNTISFSPLNNVSETDDAAFIGKLKEVLNKELRQPVEWWYLSFADDEKWLGSVVVQAAGFLMAVMKINFLNINPGGECIGNIIDGTPEEQAVKDRLLTMDDCKAVWGEMVDLKGESV